MVDNCENQSLNLQKHVKSEAHSTHLSNTMTHGEMGDVDRKIWRSSKISYPTHSVKTTETMFQTGGFWTLTPKIVL